MEVYEALKEWLREQGAIFDIDRCDHRIGSIGLFPQGVQVLRQWEDVLGNRKRRVRYRFWLRITAPPGEAMAELLLKLQAEVPKSGFSATEGTYRKAASDGLATYEIRFTAEREEMI